ncbi:MAG: PEP/pyruvate-binding domain-containing protein, partial [Anaerolineales bacterium]
MNTNSEPTPLQEFVPFDRTSNDPADRIRVIGSGEIGGKARGLVLLNQLLSSDQLQPTYEEVSLGVPTMTVLRSDVFDAFLKKNDLYRYRDGGYTDDQIAHAFQKGELPFHILGDLQALVEGIRTPLAVRSSSLLEDATFEPFAGIYSTKMIPNHQFDPGIRFQKLSEAIKFIYASTFFNSAKSYRVATGHDHSEEKMAVIIQDVVGSRHHVRFYPELSGVARSYNYYPVGRAKPEEGVVSLALGLGKTIVDGGVVWSYSPARPRSGPPYGSVNELLKNSQKEFWAINMGTPLVYDPIKETEYLVRENLAVAEKDGTLDNLCSTYDSQSDRLVVGKAHPGPRALTFGPLLQLNKLPLNDLLKEILAICEEKLENPVEIEFAMTFSPPSLGLLQVRPMVVSSQVIQLTAEDLNRDDLLAASENALGNGCLDDISDIVYVLPEQFDLAQTRVIASELAQINANLLAENRPYLLIVFGRLGSSDPWLGIPVDWGQIS